MPVGRSPPSPTLRWSVPDAPPRQGPLGARGCCPRDVSIRLPDPPVGSNRNCDGGRARASWLVPGSPWSGRRLEVARWNQATPFPGGLGAKRSARCPMWWGRGRGGMRSYRFSAGDAGGIGRWPRVPGTAGPCAGRRPSGSASGGGPHRPQRDALQLGPEPEVCWCAEIQNLPHLMALEAGAEVVQAGGRLEIGRLVVVRPAYAPARGFPTVGARTRCCRVGCRASRDPTRMPCASPG